MLTVSAAGRPGIGLGIRNGAGCSCPTHDERTGLLDESAREKLAEEITRIHCDATGIPRSYVNVMFTDMLEGGSVFPEIARCPGLVLTCAPLATGPS